MWDAEKCDLCGDCLVRCQYVDYDKDKAVQQIEELIETKVYLDLWVKVRPKWRKKENELRWLGYTK